MGFAPAWYWQDWTACPQFLNEHCAGCREEGGGGAEEEGHRALRRQDAVRRPRRDLRQEQDGPPGDREVDLGVYQEEQAQQGPHHHAGCEAEEGPARRLVRPLPHSPLRSVKVISRKGSSEARCLQVRLFRIEAFAHVGLRRFVVYVAGKSSLMNH